MTSTPLDDPPDPGLAEGPIYTCTVKGCGNTFSTRENLRNHCIRSHTPATFKCTHCSSTFGTEKGLKRHFGMEHAVKPFKCVVCSKAYTLQSSLNTHVKEHKSRPHMCQVQACQKLFKTQEELEKHEETQHPKTAFSKDGVQAVTRSMAPDPAKPYKCPHCDKWFDNKSHTEEHIDNVHNKTTHPCSQCDRIFNSSTRLRNHVKQHHPEPQTTETSGADVDQEGTVRADTYTSHEQYFEKKLKKVRSMYTSEVRQTLDDRIDLIRTVVGSGLDTDVPVIDASQRLVTGRNLFQYEKAQLVQPFPTLTNPTLEPHTNLEHILKQPSRRVLYADYVIKTQSQTVSHVQIKNVPGKLSKTRDEEAWFDIEQWKLDQPSGTVMGRFLGDLLSRLPVRLPELPYKQKHWVLSAAMCLAFNHLQNLKLKLTIPKLIEISSSIRESKLLYRFQVFGYDHAKNRSWSDGADVVVGAIDTTKQILIDNEKRYEWIGLPPVMPPAMSYKFTQLDFDKALEVAKLLGTKYIGFVGSRDEMLQDARHVVSRFSQPHREHVRDNYEQKLARRKSTTAPWAGEALWIFERFSSYSVFIPSIWMEQRMTGRFAGLVLYSVEPDRYFSIAHGMLEAKKSGYSEDEVWGIGALLADIEERRGLAPSVPISSCNNKSHSDELHICPECVKIKPHKDFQISEYRDFKVCSACHFSFDDENKNVRIDGGIVGFHLYEHLKRENIVAKIQEPATKTKAHANKIVKALNYQKIDQHRYHDGYAVQELSLLGKKYLTWDGVRLNPSFPSVDAINPVVAGSDGRTRYHYMDDTVNNIIITSDALNRAVRHYPKVMLYALRLFMDAADLEDGKELYETATAIARNCLINHYEYGVLGQSQQSHRIGQDIPDNMQALVASFHNAQLLPRTQPKEKVFRIHSTKRSTSLEDRAAWRPKHYDWLIAQIDHIANDVFGDSAATYREHWMRADITGTEVFCPASTYCVIIEVTWFDMMEMFAIKSDRNLTMCQRPHASFNPPIKYSVEELVLIVANVYLRMIKADVDAGRPDYELGRDELGLVPHLNINSLLCASLGHRWPGQSQSTGLLNFDLHNSDKVGFDPQVCGFMWETQFCNFLKFKYPTNILKDRVFPQARLIRRGVPLRGETRESLPAEDLVVSLSNEYDFQLDTISGLVSDTVIDEESIGLVLSREVQTSIDKLRSEAEDEGLETIDNYSIATPPHLRVELGAENDNFIDAYGDEFWSSVADDSIVPTTTPGNEDAFWQSVAASTEVPIVPFPPSTQCQMVNIGATCYMSAPLHVLANIPELNNALTTQIGFRLSTGRDPGLLGRIRDDDGSKHVRLHDHVCDLLATLVVDGPRLSVQSTKSILESSNALQSRWQNAPDDAASFLSFLLESIELRLDQSNPIEGSFILEKNDRGGFNRRIPYRPEEYLNMLHQADIVEGKQLPTLEDFTDRHWTAHKQSGHDNALNSCMTIQSVRMSQCDSPSCGATQRDVVYSNTISLQFPQTTKTTDVVSVYDLMQYSFKATLDPAPHCLNHAIHSSVTPGERCEEITRITHVGSIFTVEINRSRLAAIDLSASILPSDSALPGPQQMDPQAENEPFLNRLSEYEHLEMFDWVNGGPTLAVKDLPDSETYQHDLLEHESLISDYDVHAIIAYRRHHAHYTAFVKVNGEWTYFDDTALMPTVRNPFTDWPKGFVETLLFYKRVDEGHDNDAQAKLVSRDPASTSGYKDEQTLAIDIKDQESAQLRQQLNEMTEASRLKDQHIKALQNQLDSMLRQGGVPAVRNVADQETVTESPVFSKPLPEVPGNGVDDSRTASDDGRVLIEPAKGRKGTIFGKLLGNQARKEDSKGRIEKRTASGRRVRKRSIGNILTDFMKQPFTTGHPQASSTVKKTSPLPSTPPRTTEKLVPPSVVSRKPRENMFEQPATFRTRQGQEKQTPAVLPRTPRSDADTDEGSLTDMGEPPATPSRSTKRRGSRLDLDVDMSSGSKKPSTAKKYQIRKSVYKSAGHETTSTLNITPHNRRLVLGESPSEPTSGLTRSPGLKDLATAAGREDSLTRGKKRKQPSSHVSDSEDEDAMDTEED